MFRGIEQSNLQEPVWVFFTSNNSLVIFIVINYILISDLLYLFDYLFIYLCIYLCVYFSLLFIFIVYILLLCIALHCACICTLLCITLHAPAYAFSPALHCMPLYMHFSMHWITYPSICIFTCTICLYILLVSHFTCIKGFLSPLSAQTYKPRVVPSR